MMPCKTRNPVWLRQFEELRGRVGVYAFFDQHGCVYVGQATCVYSRMKSYFQSQRFQNCTEFTCSNLGPTIEQMSMKSARYLLRVEESLAIKKLKPRQNIQRPSPILLIEDAGARGCIDVARHYIAKIPPF